MTLVLECMVMCFILLIPCVVAIANGVEQAAFLFEKDVQDRVIQMGLITRERLKRNKKVFKLATLIAMVAFVLWAVYGVNGARGFWQPLRQILVLTLAEGLFDRFFIDWYWVGHTKAWTMALENPVVKSLSERKKDPENPCCCGVFGISEIIPTRSHQPASKRFCLGDLACGIHIIRITLEILAIVIFVVILLSR